MITAWRWRRTESFSTDWFAAVSNTAKWYSFDHDGGRIRTDPPEWFRAFNRHRSRVIGFFFFNYHSRISHAPHIVVTYAIQSIGGGLRWLLLFSDVCSREENNNNKTRFISLKSYWSSTHTHTRSYKDSSSNRLVRCQRFRIIILLRDFVDNKLADFRG